MDHSACKEAKRVHLLDETHVPAWGLLQTIGPVFASTGCKWKIKVEENIVEQDPAIQRENENTLGWFKDELKKLPLVVTDDDLACHVWDDCIDTLSKVLKLLESMVKDDCIQWEDQQLHEESNETNQSYYRQTLDWLLTFLNIPGDAESSATLVSFPANARHSQESPQFDSEHHTEFPRLAALATLISGDSHVGELYVEAEQPIELFKKFRTLESFRTCVEGAYRSREPVAVKTWPLGTPGISRTRWKDHGPSQALEQLHHILLTHARRCKDGHHEILLKMAGRQFEQLDFDAIMIPCRDQDRHQEVRFSSDRALAIDNDKPRQFVHRLCDTLESADTEFIPNFIFSNDGKYRLHYSRADDKPHWNISIDTTLQNLQEKRYFYKPDKGGVFHTEDKTILELSLAQSLLHLLRSPWKDLEWCATSVKFLRNDDINELLDIHHPYLTYFVRPVVPSLDRLAWYATTMTSFAQLLLEIESGEAVELEDSILADTGRRCAFLYEEMDRRDLDFKIRSNVQRAIQNCLRFYAVLASHRADPENDANFGFLVRQKVYETIILHLEDCLAGIKNNKRYLQGRNLRMQDHSKGAAFLGDGTPETSSLRISVPASSTLQKPHKNHRGTVQQQDERHSVENVMMLGSSSAPDHVAVAEKFWKYHQKFYDKYILSKGRSRHSNSRRVRIAILDTGMDRHDSFLISQIQGIEQNRRNRVRREFASKPTRDGHGPDFSTCNPIKASKSFLASGSGESTIDRCSHGTMTLGLLLRIAPDADVYVAKVADNIKFGSTSAIAIKWAVHHDVDIISMSLGMKSEDADISRAISSIDSNKTIMFASASNGGTGVPHAFPASDYRVIAVHALSGNGDEGSMNPITEGNQDAFGTLGYGIKATWKNEERILNGTSYSTPIIAGIVANFFEWVDSVAGKDSVHDVTEAEKEYWKSPNGIRHILRQRMSRRKTKLDFVFPWKLFPLDNATMDADIIVMLRQMDHAPARNN